MLHSTRRVVALRRDRGSETVAEATSVELPSWDGAPPSESPRRVKLFVALRVCEDKLTDVCKSLAEMLGLDAPEKDRDIKEGVEGEWALELQATHSESDCFERR